MSHFAVLVVGDNYKKKLAPYHEFECTGRDDKYVQDIDITEDAKEELKNHKVSKLKDPDGNYHDPYDEKFYRQPTDEELDIIENRKDGYREINFTRQTWDNGEYEVRIKEIPDDYEEVRLEDERSLKEWADYWYSIDTFVTEDELEKIKEQDEYPEDMKYGYGVVDENDEIIALYDRTNPNKKWDWYEVGGRYAGRLKLKEDVEPKTRPNFSWGWDRDSMQEVINDRRVDQALKGDVDWDALHPNPERYEEASRFWELHVEGEEPQNEEEEEMVKFVLRKPEFYKNRYKTKEKYAACQANFTMWAVVTEDGEWVEKGDMGWWGISGESDEEAVVWEMNFFDKFIKPLDDDTLLTIVDCHI